MKSECVFVFHTEMLNMYRQRNGLNRNSICERSIDEVKSAFHILIRGTQLSRCAFVNAAIPKPWMSHILLTQMPPPIIFPFLSSQLEFYFQIFPVDTYICVHFIIWLALLCKSTNVPAINNNQNREVSIPFYIFFSSWVPTQTTIWCCTEVRLKEGRKKKSENEVVFMEKIWIFAWYASFFIR